VRNFESFSEPEPSTSKESEEPRAGIRSSEKPRGYSSEDSDEAEPAERNDEAEMVEKSDETELAGETSKGTLPLTDRVSSTAMTFPRPLLFKPASGLPLLYGKFTDD